MKISLIPKLNDTGSLNEYAFLHSFSILMLFICLSERRKVVNTVSEIPQYRYIPYYMYKYSMFSTKQSFFEANSIV